MLPQGTTQGVYCSVHPNQPKPHLKIPKHGMGRDRHGEHSAPDRGSLENPVTLVKRSHSISELAMIGSVMLHQYPNRPGFTLSLSCEMQASC